MIIFGNGMCVDFNTNFVTNSRILQWTKTTGTPSYTNQGGGERGQGAFEPN